MRGRVVAGCVALVAIALVVVALRFIGDTYNPRSLESYEVSAGSREITVSFCGSTAETIILARAIEDARSVVVAIRVWIARDVFTNGTVHRATFTLASPLGDRVVREPNGNAVPRSAQFLCPG